MSRQIKVRRGQRKPPSLPTDTVKVPRYPNEPGAPDKMSWWLVIAPAFGMMAMAVGVGFITQNYLYPLIIISVAFIYPIVMLLRRREATKRWEQERARVRDAYVARIAQVESQLEDFSDQQRRYLLWEHPELDELVHWPARRSERLWERRAGDSDFLDLRLGVGDAAVSFVIDAPSIDIPELAPELMVEARQMALGYQVLNEAPLSYNLTSGGSLGVTGPQRLREGFARALISEAAALHAPDDLGIYAVLPSKGVGDWNWIKWLPHTHAIRSNSGPPRLAYDTGGISSMMAALLDELEARRLREAKAPGETREFILLVLVDGEAVRGETAIQRILDDGLSLNAAIIQLTAHPQNLLPGVRARMEIANERRATFYARESVAGVDLKPEHLDVNRADRLSRALAPLELAETTGTGELPNQIRLMDLVGSPDVKRVDLSNRWLASQSRPPNLSVPLGVRHGARPLIANLKQSGQGPHGLIAGTTGSGKSELLLTLLTGLALDNHPHQVNFVLVDYKGGTAMSVLEGLPHTVGVVTDLDGKQTRRALVALRSELTRREEILARHQVADVDKYHEMGIAEPFPYLFIVIDEFAELRDRFKHDLGEILNEFVSIAQKGRALGVHLILAMQRPEGVVNESIRANMRFRICLRVERAEDSRNVLGRPDAYLLPSNQPGRAYFQVGNDEQFDLFQVARIAGYYREDGAERSLDPVLIQEVAPDGRRITLFEIEPAEVEPSGPKGKLLTEAQIFAQVAKEAAEQLEIQRLKSPWPPALPTVLPLPKLFETAGQSEFDGKDWPITDSPGAGVPIGLLDQPESQRQDPLMIDFQQRGNLLIIGAPGSGRTVTLMTLVAANARVYPPSQIHFHLIDFGGHQMRAAFSQLPHVAGSYDGDDLDHVRRLLSNLQSELDSRRRLFESMGIVDFSRYLKSAPENAELPAIMTIINNYSGFQEAFNNQVDELIGLLREGGDYGLYFALSSDRFPTGKVADLIPQRIALQLSDQMMYSVILDGRPDFSTFDPVPGRGFYSSKPPIDLQIALPTDEPPEHQIMALQELGALMTSAWTGPRPAPVRMLAEELPLARVLEEAAHEDQPQERGVRSWFAYEDKGLSPKELAFDRIGSYFLITGPPQSGKTTALASILLALGARYEPEHVHFALVTPKRGEHTGIAEICEMPHCLGHAKNEKSLDELLAAVELGAEERLAAETELPASPARMLLVIDDYHLLSGRIGADALSRLERLAKRAGDIGLTMMVTAPSTVLSSLSDSIIRGARAWRNGIWLKSTDSLESNVVGVRMPLELRGKELPPGRGFLYDPGGQELIQVASPEVAWSSRTDLPGSMTEWVKHITHM